MSADDVGLDEGVGALDRAVDVRFGGEVHDGVDALLAQQLLDQRGIADIAVDESELRQLR